MEPTAGSDGRRLRESQSSGAVRVEWSGPAAVRWFVERVVAARRGGHPAPPDIG
ncbi:MAG: hypothetical protein MUC33_00185 [Desulfobacterales bacterium]|nr:hypothetical protein [Desulfobacterales bacterium]